ncbi:MAG TPA: glutaredoxin family protein [Burkholderiales bacterium]
MRAVIFAALLAAASAAGAQQLYRWIDAQGRVHVTDTPPPPTAKSAQTRTVSTGGAAQAPGESLPYGVQLAAKNFPVTLYTAPECGPCGEARSLLNARGVPFREVLVTEEAQQQELQKAVGALAVPSIIVGGSVQKGFEQGAYHDLLDIAGYPKTGEVPARQQAAPKPAPAPAAATEEAQAKPAVEPETAAGGPYSPGSTATGQRTRK